jgi:hypothetical protein
MLNLVMRPSWRRRSEREGQYHARTPLCDTNPLNRFAWGDRISPARTRAAIEGLAFADLGLLAARHGGPVYCPVNCEIFLCKKRVTLQC